MDVTTLSEVAVQPPKDAAAWKAARDLQAAFFSEMMKHGGFLEAFSTGSDSLDALSSQVVELVAERITTTDTTMAEQFYRQLMPAEG